MKKLIKRMKEAYLIRRNKLKKLYCPHCGELFAVIVPSVREIRNCKCGFCGGQFDYQEEDLKSEMEDNA